MNIEIQDNYNVFKREMRKFLKNNKNLDEQRVLNNQLLSMIETLKDMNSKSFDVDLQNKIGNMYQDFLPYMVSYWMIKEVNIPPVQNIEPNSVYGS